MEILGYISALLVGISMGLIGGGGSILAMPILIYLFHIDPLTATSYSLFMVGITSLAGVSIKLWEKQVDLKMTLLFGIPDIIGVLVMRTYIFPPIPGNLFMIMDHMVTKGEAVLIIFSLLMIFSSILLIKRNQDLKKLTDETHGAKSSIFFIITGFLTGLLTGMVGVGGGFIIIPILVIWARLPMKLAIGTSIAIIATKSLIGFLSDKFNFSLDHNLLWYITAISLVGLIIGNILSKKIPSRKLQLAFGFIVILVGIYMFLNTLFIII